MFIVYENSCKSIIRKYEMFSLACGATARSRTRSAVTSHAAAPGPPYLGGCGFHICESVEVPNGAVSV